MQLVVHIARTDWPEKYPEFFNDILILISSTNSSSTILGLLFLQTTSEELGSPRDNLPFSRKAELKQRLLQFVPQTLTILTGNCVVRGFIQATLFIHLFKIQSS